jgi:pimeloyl-ACP methyl ester carboxylesterase
VTVAKLEERSLDLDGRRVTYLGGGDGPPLVLVHGLGGSATNWCELAPLLLPGHRLVIPNLPGHARSDRLAAPAAGLEPYAETVAAVMEHERMVPAPVVGHSLGGLVAVRLALRRPDAVSALVLAGSAGLSTGRRFVRELLTIATVLRPGRLAGRYRSRVSRSAWLRRLVFGFVSVADPIGLTDSAVDGFLAGQALHTDTATAWRALRREDPRQELGRLECSVLVLWGTEDAQLPLDDAFEYARRLRAPLRVIAGCGHLLIGERPEPCADAIEAFLASVGSPSGQSASVSGS